MKRKEYKRPTIQVVKLQQRGMLLDNSVHEATRKGYVNGNSELGAEQDEEVVWD